MSHSTFDAGESPPIGANFRAGRVTRLGGPWDRRGVRVVDFAECYEKYSADLIRYAAAVVGPSAAEDVLSSAVVGLLAADMAGVAVYLASRAGAYVTGAVIPVDGGMATCR